MSLRDEITVELAQAFDTDLADAVSTFTGSRVIGQGPYDPITDTRPVITENYSGRGVFGSFAINIVDGVQILRTDVKVTALQAEVTQAPKVDDTITQGGTAYKVIHVGKDPVSATWVIQLRAT